MLHDDEIQSVEEKLEVEVKDTKEKVRIKNIHSEYVDVNHDELLEEAVMIINECSIVAPVSN